jgi:lipoprotein-anchoring transpeptidase ErfK/SrfK
MLGYATYHYLPVSTTEQALRSDSTTAIKKQSLTTASTSEAITPRAAPVSVVPAPIPQQSVGRTIQNKVELQMALARAGFSPGSIDGMSGAQTQQALLAYQQANQLPATGTFNSATQISLKISEPIYSSRVLQPADFLNIDPPPNSWKERGTRTRMAYHSILEMIAEKCMSDPDLIQQLNPTINFLTVPAGTQIITPVMPPLRIHRKLNHIRISLSNRTLQAIDTTGNIIFHCPVSIARRVDKRPSGELQVKVRVAEPNYTFNPAILSGTAAREGITQKFVIQPGPNNPVGSVWIGLNLPSYGIHGTPEPEKVGRTESSGCFRLANWNAETLLDLVEVGTPIYVEP